VLYSGFTAAAVWTFWLAFRRRDRFPRWWRDGWPVGYRLGAIGVLIFFVAGLADMTWHVIFGVETDLDALMSPSHLLLAVGATLLLTSPVRSWWATDEGGVRAATGLAALALGTVSVGIFLLYTSAFDFNGAQLPSDGLPRSAGYTMAAHGVTTYIVTSAMVVVPMLMVLRRRAVFGAATALVTPIALFPAAVNEFDRTFLVGGLAGITAAIVADLITTSLDRTRGLDAPLRLPIAAATVAALVPTAHLLALQLDSGITWVIEVWSGTVVISAALAALLGGLAARPAEVVRELR
jgi:hypothetical protein